MASIQPDALAKMNRKYGEDVVTVQLSKFDEWARAPKKDGVVQPPIQWENDQHYTRSFWKSLTRSENGGFISPVSGYAPKTLGGQANVQQERSSSDLEGITDLVLLLIWGYATGAGGFPVSERLKELCEKHPSLAAKIGGCVLSIEGAGAEPAPNDEIPF